MDEIIDNGPTPVVTNVVAAALGNTNYRSTVWTGNNLQMTVMSIEPGHDIGMEVHATHDQFIRIEEGFAKVSMGPSQDQLRTWEATSSDAVFVPAGTWHNLECTGQVTLKVYSIYAPPQHPYGTVHVTQHDAEVAEAAQEAQQ